MADPAPAGGSVFTDQYGPLKGWQWLGIITAAGAAFLWYRQRKAASSSSSTTGLNGIDPATGLSYAEEAAASGPLPGSQSLAPIIIQNGPPSQPAPTTTPPSSAKAPNQLTVANFPAPGNPGEKIVQIVQSAPGIGYALTNQGGVETAGGAPFWGSYLGLPAAARQGGPRTFRSIQLTPAGYTLEDTAGEKYNFGRGLKQIGQ